MPKKYYKQKKKKKKKNEDKHKPLSVPTKSGFILLLVGINDFPQIQPKLRWTHQSEKKIYENRNSKIKINTSKQTQYTS